MSATRRSRAREEPRRVERDHRAAAQVEYLGALAGELCAADILCGPINTVADVLFDPALAACLPIAEIGLPNVARTMGAPIRYNGEFFSARRATPAKGQHTRELLTEIGYGGEEIEAVLASGAAFIETQ